ncbi:MAG: magnesium transporter CorA family protein [Deltaproteobacteria bacterium]|jgi:magnesium transporter|nr:magnesium transporter CorA family protein [Deltaproteobacteria bacterium]
MLTRYKYADHGMGFVVCKEGEKPQWINLEDPCQEELDEIHSELGVPMLFLTDPLDPKERPRLDQEEGCDLMIISVPYLNDKERDVDFDVTPLGFILCGEVMISVCSEVGLIGDLLSRAHKKPKPVTAKKTIIKILIESAIDFINHLELMERLTDSLEFSLSKSQQNKEILTLLTIEKALIVYTVALKSTRGIVAKVVENKTFFQSQEELDLVDLALTENQQAIYMADIFGQIIGSVGDAFGNIISNNLNKVMKFLTGVTIILMLPTLVVGAYGMNVALPLAEHGTAFWLIAIICAVLSGVVWLYFLRKRWI